MSNKPLGHKNYGSIPHLFGAKYTPEGLVYRCERKGEFDFMAKWVRPDFIPGKYLEL